MAAAFVLTVYFRILTRSLFNLYLHLCNFAILKAAL